MAVIINTLKAGDDNDFPSAEIFLERAGVDHFDLRFGVHLVGENSGLRTGVADRINPNRLERHRRQRDRLLFTDGEQLVHLPLGRVRMNQFGARDELVGHAGASRDDDDKLVPLVAKGLDTIRDVLDAVDVTD